MGYSLVLGGGPQFVRGFPPHLFLGVLPRVYYKHPNLGVILLSCLSCLRVLQHQFICLLVCSCLFLFSVFGGLRRRRRIITFYCCCLMSQKLEIMSLNVNGLGNPIKRARVMTKIKKENKHVVFLQETHLSPQENEKLKKCGYRKVYYSSHVHSHKRGVAILILNSFTFEIIKEIKDKEGCYIKVKGKTSNSILTLVCIYAPPNSDKSFFKDLLDVIALEAEGVCICGGDLNIILNYDLDTTSQNRNKKCLTKYLNTTLEDDWTIICYLKWIILEGKL